MATFHRRLLRNAFGGLTGTAVNLVIGVLLTPVTVRYLGLSGIGILSLVNAVVGYSGLLDLGLGPAVVRATAHHLSADTADVRALNRTLSTAFFVYIGIGLAAAAVIAGGGLLAATRFQMTAAEVRQFQVVLAIVTVQTALSFPCSVWNGVVGGLQDYHVLSAMGIVANLARAALTVGLLVSGFGLVSLATAGAFLSVCGWIGAFWWAHHRVPGVRVAWSLVARSQVRELSHVSGVMVVWSLAGYALHQMDRVFVGLLAPVAAVGLYDIGARLVGFARNVIDNWLSTVLPAATQAHARGDREGIRAIYLATTRYVMLTFGAFVAPALLLGALFLRLWLGAGFDVSAAVLAWLVVGTAYQSHNVVAHVILPGIGRLRFFGTFMGAYAAIVVAGQFGGGVAGGAVGVAAGTTLAVIAIESWLTPRVWRLVGVSSGEALATMYLPALKPMAVSAVAIALVRVVMSASTWPALVLAALAGGATYAAAAWRWGLKPAERDQVWRRLAAAMPGATAPESAL